MSFSVIIPSRNIDNLVQCVAAVRRCEPDARIIVVDDGLGHDGRQLMWSYGVETIAGVEPFVFSRNVNKGIEYSHHRFPPCERANSGGHYTCTVDCVPSGDIVILNDDALLQTPGGFSVLERCASHLEYGIIASTCNNVGNPNQWPSQLDCLRDEPRMVCFVCVYIPRRTIEAVGLLDEDFTGYGCEDDEYCFRVRRAGLKIGITDGCYVDHGSLSSSFRGGPKAGGDFRANLKIFIAKYGVDNWGRTKEESEFPELFP